MSLVLDIVRKMVHRIVHDIDPGAKTTTSLQAPVGRTDRGLVKRSGHRTDFAA
jgi:hypothetical protein